MYLYISFTTFLSCRSTDSFSIDVKRQTEKKDAQEQDTFTDTDEEDTSDTDTLPIDSGEDPLYEAENTTLNRYHLVNAQERNAVCNDGSAPVYYYKEGSGEGKNKWLIWLQGGAGCATPEECALRELSTPELMSSIHHVGQPVYETNGVFVEDSQISPEFHNWTKVFLCYCSSDHWSGNRSAEETGDYHFRGHNILNGFLEDLSNPELFPNINLTQAQELLIGGNSAGALGLQINIDRVADIYSEIPIKGYFDSHFKPLVMLEREIQLGFNDETVEFLNQKIEYQGLIPDETCAAQETEIVRCFQPYLQPYIETPYFVLMDQYDFMCSTTTGAVQLGYFQDAMSSTQGRFAPAENIHVWSNISQFYLHQVQGYSGLNLLENWYFQRDELQTMVDPIQFNGCDDL
ncbi:MAG: hypothetical protein CMK59_07085 [Proteobacteria bacterium]|nr:hypothetical protein [Pseudomonadota bacterium]